VGQPFGAITPLQTGAQPAIFYALVDILKLLKKIKLVKDVEKHKVKIEENLDDFHKNAILIATNYRVLIKVMNYYRLLMGGNCIDSIQKNTIHKIYSYYYYKFFSF